MRAAAPLRRTASAVNLCLTLVPAVSIGLFTVQALWMRSSLGRWPVVYRDIAAGGVAVALDWLTSAGLMAVLFGAPLWALSLAAAWRTLGRDRAAVRVGIHVGALVVLLVVKIVNPYGFPEWWLD
jgi:hypothetical protein